MNMIEKYFWPDIKQVDGEDRTMWVIGSTDERDRDGDVIDQKSWRLENFQKNPVILWAHQHDRPPIAKALDSKIEDNKLKLKIQFAGPDIDPFADQIYKLYQGGFMRTFSVGFMPYKVEPLTDAEKAQHPEMPFGNRLHAELLELSAVPVPSNPSALGLREMQEVFTKGFNPEKAGRVLSEANRNLLQSCHDAMCEAMGKMGTHLDVMKGLLDSTMPDMPGASFDPETVRAVIETITNLAAVKAELSGRMQ